MADDIENSFNNSFVDEPSDESQSEQHGAEQNHREQNPDAKIANIIQQLQKSGALLKKKPVENHHCFACGVNFEDVAKLHVHLLDHVVLPSLVLKRVDDDDANDEDEWFSDPEKSSEYTVSPITISQGMNVTKIGGITIKSNKVNASALPASLKSIGNLLIKKIPNVSVSVSEPKEEFFDYDTKINSPLGTKSSGTLKLKIKHSDKKFQVVNGSETDCKTEDVSQDGEKSGDGSQNESVEPPMKDDEDPIDEAENAAENDTMFEEHEEKKVVVGDFMNASIKKEPQLPNDEPDGAFRRLANVKVKTESQPEADNSENQLKVKSFANEPKRNDSIVVPKPLLIPKVESNVIEINCDSDKEDDEIIFVSSSSVPDKKPPIGLPPNLESKGKEVSSTTSAATHPEKLSSPAVSQSVINSSNMPSVSVSASTEKQHSFNWNAPSKSNEPWDNLLADKNNDTLLENILSSHRKDGMSEFGSSEYISLDKLGPQHTCDICNVKFTSFSALDDHKKTTGHSNQLVMPKSVPNVLQPYQQPGLLVNDLNLLPMKQLAETVGKIAGVKTSSAPFTHQQNIMVNIQSFPGGMNHQPMGIQPQTVPANYNYPSMHPMPNNYQGFRMPHPNAPPPQFPNHYPMASQSSYPINSYPHPQYVPPSPQNMYNQPLNTQPNHNFSSQPYQPNYSTQPSMHYPPVPPTQIQTSNQMQPPAPPPQPVIQMPNSSESMPVNHQPNPAETIKTPAGGIKIQSIQTVNSSVLKSAMNSPKGTNIKEIRCALPGKGTRIARGGSFRPIRPSMRSGMQVGLSIRGSGIRPVLTRGIKRPGPSNGTLGSPKKRMEMLLPDRHDNEDCQVVSLQQQRDGLPLIQSVQGSRERNTPNVQLNSQLTVTKTKVRAPSPPPSAKDANAVANILASRGIKITQKSKTPPPSINIPNLGSSISVTPAKTIPSSFSLPENDFPCSLCNKVFTTNSTLTMHMAQMHPSQKMFRCDACPISYPSALQLQEHKLAFHNVPNSELGIPVIDLSQLGTLRKLCNLGITNFIPLANREQGGGCFGIPIVSASNALSGNVTNSLLSLGANGILSFGPVKPLPKC